MVIFFYDAINVNSIKCVVRMRGIGGILSSSEKLSIKFMFYICLLTFKLNIHLSKA